MYKYVNVTWTKNKNKQHGTKLMDSWKINFKKTSEILSICYVFENAIYHQKFAASADKQLI